MTLTWQRNPAAAGDVQNHVICVTTPVRRRFTMPATPVWKGDGAMTEVTAETARSISMPDKVETRQPTEIEAI
jgi:hypothetical protein